MKERYFWTGLLMCVFNLLGVVLYLSKDALSKVSLGEIVGGMMWGIYTLVSVVLLVYGILSKE